MSTEQMHSQTILNNVNHSGCSRYKKFCREARGTVMENEKKRNGALHRFTLKTIKPMPEIRIAGRLRLGLGDEGSGFWSQNPGFRFYGSRFSSASNKQNTGS